MSEPLKKSRWAVDDEEEQEKEQLKQKPSKQRKIVSSSSPPPPPPTQSKAVRKVIMRTEEAVPKVYPYLRGCRHVDCFEKLNHIEEGSYGIVFRARDKESGEVVAVKKLKLNPENGGFPVTSLREIHALMIIKHPNIVNVKEIVMGNHMDQ
jgi:cell division cycle 2-like protein